MEPRKQGLIITTSSDYRSKLFFWYCEQPRCLGTSDIAIHHPIVHNKGIYLLTGAQDSFGGNKNSVRKAFSGEIWYTCSESNNWLLIDCLASYEGAILGTRCSSRRPISPITGRPYRTSDILRLSSPYSVELFSAVPEGYVLDMTNKDILTTLEILPNHFPGGIRKVWQRKPIEKLIRDHVPGLLPSAVANYRDNIVLGHVGMIEEQNKGQAKLHSVIDTVAETMRDAYEKLEELAEKKAHATYDLQSYQKKYSALEQKMLRTAVKNGFHDNEEDLESAAIFLEKHFRINHLTDYNEHLIFSMHKSLYVLGMPEPLHTFRQPITGLAVVEFDLLDELKGKASVRKGMKTKGFSLLQRVA